MRVAVTGLGVKTPAGNDLETFWSTLASGRSTAAPITRFDPSPLPVRFACEVRDFDPTSYLGPKEARRIDRFTQLGIAAAADALADAGELGADPARSAVIIGTGVGGLMTLEEQITVYLEKGAGRVSPFLVPMMMANATAGNLAMRFGWTGPNLCVATACAASAQRDRRSGPARPRRHRRRRHDRRDRGGCDANRGLGVRAHDRLEHA